MKEVKYTQIHIFADVDDYSKLKSVLAEQKKTVKAWFAEKALEEVTKYRG